MGRMGCIRRMDGVNVIMQHARGGADAWVHAWIWFPVRILVTT